MSGPIAQPTSQVTIVSVGRSWTQENRERFAWPKVPRVRVNSRDEGYSNSTLYEIPNEDNFMLKGRGRKWEPTQGLPPDDNIESTEVTLTVTSRIGRVIPRVLAPDNPRRHRDLEDGIIPGLLGEGNQIMDHELVLFLKDTANYGAKVPFSGTDTLDSKDSDGTQQPLRDMRNELQTLRKFQDREGFELVLYVDRNVIDVFAVHPDFHGAGVSGGSPAGGSGAGSAGILPRRAVIDILMNSLDIDEVVVMTAVRDTARKGLASSLDYIGAGVCTFVVVDKRQSEWDMRDGIPLPQTSPEGGLVMGLNKEPTITNGVDELGEAERFKCREVFGYLNPRGTAYGVIFDEDDIFAP